MLKKHLNTFIDAFIMNPEDPNVLKWYVIALGKTI